MLVDTQDPAPARRAARRGTSNKNVTGSSKDRAARRAWLVDTFRADVDVIVTASHTNGCITTQSVIAVPLGEGRPACRCFRCGKLLTTDTVSPDRIKPGCQGGTYRRTNIRPSCLPCNVSLGGILGASRRSSS